MPNSSNDWRKLAKRLLLNPEGREAMKEFGIDVQMSGAPEAKDKPTVVILCPTYRAPQPQMQDALSAMVKYTREKDVATVYGGPPIQSSVVHWSRNGLIIEHMKSGKPWTHVLFIDDDIVVEPDALSKLLSHGKDIIGGLCTRRTDPPVPNIRLLESDKFRQIWEWPEKELLEVGAIGTGLLLLSQHALEQVAQVYFDCLWEQEFYDLKGEKLQELRRTRLEAFEAQKVCYWFRFLPSFGEPIEMGEDVTFCFLAKRYAGLSTFVDTSVQPGHIGNYAFAIRDFLPYRDEMILKAKVEGNYPMEVPPMKLSILCPTRGRPENVRRFIRSVHETSTEAPEIIFYVDEDDDTGVSDIVNDEMSDTAIVVRGERIMMSAMWNKCAEAATGELLMVRADDIVFKTKDWDEKVRRAFAAFEDRIVLVHGDDQAHGLRFGTHPIIHRRWYEVVGYVTPPYFSGDCCDVWLNDVGNALNRRIPLQFVNEHMHPVWGKGSWDKTHEDRLKRINRDNPQGEYIRRLPEREKDIAKLRQVLGTPYEMVNPDSHSTVQVGTPEEAEATASSAIIQ